MALFALGIIVFIAMTSSETVADFIFKITLKQVRKKRPQKDSDRTFLIIVRVLFGLFFLGLFAWMAWDTYANGFHPLHSFKSFFE